MSCSPSSCCGYTDEPCVAPSGLGRLVVVRQEGEGDLGDCQRPLVRHLQRGRVGGRRRRARARLDDRGRREEGNLGGSARARVLADWHMGEVELHAVFPAHKAAKPSKAIRISRARVPRGTRLSSSSKKELRSKQAKRSERNFCWRCAGWFGSFLEEWPGRIRTLSGASDVKLRFEMKLLQTSESCIRSHNDLARFGRADPRNLTIWSAESYSTRVARNDRFGCVA